MKPKSGTEQDAIEGLLVPVRWNAGGEVAQVSLMTFDEAEYHVDQAEVETHGLRRHLRKHVRILGRIRGRRVTEVTNVEVFDTDEPASLRRRRGREEQ